LHHKIEAKKLRDKMTRDKMTRDKMTQLGDIDVTSKVTHVSPEPSLTINEPSIFNGSAKNPQTNDISPALTKSEKDILNKKVAPIFAKQIGRDRYLIPTKNDLRQVILFGVKMAKEVCPLDLASASKKVLEDLARAAITIWEKPGNEDDKLTGFKSWWYNEYWLGRDKNQAPTPEQVGNTWGQFEAAREILSSEATTGPTLTEAEKKRLAELTAQFQQ
jgi:hypothetical protein